MDDTDLLDPSHPVRKDWMKTFILAAIHATNHTYSVLRFRALDECMKRFASIVRLPWIKPIESLEDVKESVRKWKFDADAIESWARFLFS